MTLIIKSKGRKRIKKGLCFVLIMCLLTFSLLGCNYQEDPVVPPQAHKESTITVAAAASLKNCLDDKLIPMFIEKNPSIKIQSTYDSSGKLQTQIEEGASVDVFMSAAMKQMNTLSEKGLIAQDSIVQLLENKIVLIVPEGNELGISRFENVIKAKQIAIGDPDSVPAGQYAKEALMNLRIWDQVAAQASLGTSVAEVLNWVAEGSAEAGFVYSTDAAGNGKVEVVAEAPTGSVSKIIYPVGIVKATKNEEAVKTFIEFLQSDEAIKVFESYGFAANR